jgi:hypothetical protein
MSMLPKVFVRGFRSSPGLHSMPSPYNQVKTVHHGARTGGAYTKHHEVDQALNILRLQQCIRSSQTSSMSKQIMNGEGTRYVFVQSGVDQLCLNELQRCA